MATSYPPMYPRGAGGRGDKIGSLGTNKDGNKYLHFQVWINGKPVNPTDYIDFQKKGWFST